MYNRQYRVSIPRRCTGAEHFKISNTLRDSMYRFSSELRTILILWHTHRLTLSFFQVYRVTSNTGWSRGVVSEEKNFSESLAPNWFGNKSIISMAHSAVSKNRAVFLFAAPAAKFWKPDISSTLEKAFAKFWRSFWMLNSLPKRSVLVHKNSLAPKLYHYPSWVVISRIWKTFCQTSSGLGTG